MVPAKPPPPVSTAVGGLRPPAQASRPAAAPTGTAARAAIASQRPRAVGLVNEQPFDGRGADMSIVRAGQSC